MVRPNHELAAALPHALSMEAGREELRALLSLFGHLKELMTEWHHQCKGASDETILVIAEYYQTLCRDLDLRMAQFERESAKAGLAMDLTDLHDARLHIALILAMNAANVLKGEKDAREGRTVTLEQMRRELRNPAK